MYIYIHDVYQLIILPVRNGDKTTLRQARLKLGICDSKILKLQCCLFICCACEHRHLDPIQEEGTDEFSFYIDELFPNIAFLTL